MKSRGVWLHGGRSRYPKEKRDPKATTLRPGHSQPAPRFWSLMLPSGFTTRRPAG